MLKIFRNIRRSLFAKNTLTPKRAEGRAGRYLFYALGEIVLLVIGILIALSVNNWNTKKQERKEISSYFVKIQDELKLTKEKMISLNLKLDNNYAVNKRSLDILSLGDKDSLHLLKQTLGTLGVNHTTNLSLPIIEEFFEKGLLSKVESDSIKSMLQAIKIMSKSLQSYDAYLDAQYVNSIEPYFYEFINYSEVTGSRRKYLRSGGPLTDFQQFHQNLKIWNLITFKIESIEEHQSRLKKFISLLNSLDKQLLESTGHR